jgi:hypothetical protein
LKFNSEEIHFLIQCLEGVQIKGKDALFVSKLLIRFSNQFKKEVEKQNGDLEKDTK